LEELILPTTRAFYSQESERSRGIFLGISVTLLILYFIFSMYSYFGEDKIILLKAEALHTQQKLYKDVKFSFGDYVTGIEGTLSYKAKSFVDFLVLGNFSGSNIIDLIAIFIAALILYKSVSGLEDKKPSSEKIIKTFNWILGIAAVMYLMDQYFYLFVARPFFSYRTNGMFELQEVKGNNFLYFLILVSTAVYFLKQGNRLQQEQELTI
jgi:hypothetical protein